MYEGFRPEERVAEHFLMFRMTSWKEPYTVLYSTLLQSRGESLQNKKALEALKSRVKISSREEWSVLSV
jgi:lipoprotein NlpI